MRTLVVWLFVAVTAFAQIGVPPFSPAVCGGLNLVNAPSDWVNVPVGTTLAIAYSPPAPMRAEQIEFYMALQTGGAVGIILPSGTVTIQAANPSGAPSGTPLATGTLTGLPGGGGGGPAPVIVSGFWSPITLNTALELTFGSVYWITYANPTVTLPTPIGAQNSPPGPNPVVSLVSTNGGATWSPGALSDLWSFRISSSNCNAGSIVPGWTPLGAGCTALGTAQPSLLPSGPVSVLNPTIVNLQVQNAPPGAAVTLFWSFGAGTGLPLGGGCMMWLEPTSFFSLVASGVNPIATFNANAFGSATFFLPSSTDPTIINQAFAFQAAVPAATAIGFALTEAEVLQVGW